MNTLIHHCEPESLFERHKYLGLAVSFCLGLFVCLTLSAINGDSNSHGKFAAPIPSELDSNALDVGIPLHPIQVRTTGSVRDLQKLGFHPWDSKAVQSVFETRTCATHDSLISLRIRLQI